MVKTFDLIIIGSGSGLNDIPDGWKVAIVEKSKFGGTCLTRGCIPSKIIIHSADVAETIRASSKFGVNATINGVKFGEITSRASTLVDNNSRKIEKNLSNSDDITVFKGEGKFIDKRTIKINKEIITSKKIIIAVGARPSIPNIPGLKDVKYITSNEALRLKKQPQTLTIIGGGYIATELAHFYGGLGTKINIIERGKTLISREDKDVANEFTKLFKKKYNVLTEHAILSVSQKGHEFAVELKNAKGKTKIIKSDQLLVAAGVVPNSDTLSLQNTGIATDKHGFIEVDDYLETSVKGIWALGDVIGTFMLKHSANYEADIVYQNAILGKNTKRDYRAMPHAIFSSPQIAGVGLTEQELQENKMDYAKGTYKYIKTGMGLAMQEEEGFVKILVNPRTRKILGCHILGSDASILIHEVLVAMRNNLPVDALSETIHIHPALSEVVQRAVNSIEW